MMQRILNLHYNKLIIGADLDALHFSSVNNIPFIYTRILKPFEYDCYDSKDRTDEYKKKFYDLSFNQNLCPLSNFIFSVRLEDSALLKVVTKNNLLVNLTYNKLFLFDDYKIEGLPIPDHTTTKINLVNDYFTLSSIISEYNNLSFEDDLIKYIHFNKKNKDKRIHPIVSSLIPSVEINNIEWSDLAVKMKLYKILQSNNFKGRWDKTNNQFKKISLVHKKRNIFPLWKNVYCNLPSQIEQMYG